MAEKTARPEYDAEDILDEIVTKALECQLMAQNDQATTSSCITVQSFISSYFNSLKFNHDMGSKIAGIDNRLDELCKLKKKLGLATTLGATSSSYISQITETTCLPADFSVGRDDEKERILEMVVRDHSSTSDANFQVIPIVGMGGIGKTTLAKVVYNDADVPKTFNLKAWVCVFQGSDLLSISNAILQTSTSSTGYNLNDAQSKLKERVDGKKFLLVLDDVWDNKFSFWQTLRSPFIGGARGSKIIVTTRNLEVALMMGLREYYDLKRLPEVDCWSVFTKYVLENRDPGAYGNLEVVRGRVLAWCKGLPLAARTLGGLFRQKERHRWEGIMNIKIWELPSKECDILPVLKLSYQHLSLHLKRCFAYCAIFPKDFEFKETKRTLLWMAEGFICWGNYKINGNVEAIIK